MVQKLSREYAAAAAGLGEGGGEGGYTAHKQGGIGHGLC